MEMKSVENWNEVAADYQRTYYLGLNDYNAGLLGFWQRSGMIFPGCKALDIGCGVGKYGSYLAALGCDVTLTDISPEMIRLAEKNMEKFASPWRACVCDFDTITGEESEFLDGFDFAISTMSPAIQDVKTVRKMSALTHGWCFITRFSSWNQPSRDRLLAELGIEPKHSGERFAADCEEMIKIVSDAGYSPQVKYVEYNWCDIRTIEETAEYMQSRYLKDLDYAVEKSAVIGAAEKLCNSDGLFEDSVNTKVAWIYWSTQERNEK